MLKKKRKKNRKKEIRTTRIKDKIKEGKHREKEELVEAQKKNAFYIFQRMMSFTSFREWVTATAYIIFENITLYYKHIRYL